MPAKRFDKQETYWTYKAPPTPSDPPPNSKMTDTEWRSLSPGMRREIWRDYDRRTAK
jgi:hypothetical protein